MTTEQHRATIDRWTPSRSLARPAQLRTHRLVALGLQQRGDAQRHPGDQPDRPATPEEHP